jgi:hypothetical protein
LDSWWKFKVQQELIIGGAGTQTSTLAFGGSDSKWKYIKQNLYDGTSWATNSGRFRTPRGELGGTGTSNISSRFRWFQVDGASTAATEEYTGAGHQQQKQ